MIRRDEAQGTRIPTRPAPKSGSSLLPAWIGVAVLWLFYVLALMDRGVISLMVGPLMQDLNISAIQVGVLQGYAFALMYTIAAIPVGWAVDHVVRRYILVTGVLVWSIGTIGCGLAASFGQMVTARAVVGLGEAVLVPTALSLIADMFPRARIATATAVLSSGATVGAGTALILGGILLGGFEKAEPTGLFGDLRPWRAVFLVFGAVGLVAAWLAFLVPDARRQRFEQTTIADKPASMIEFGRFLRQHIVVLAYVFLSFPLLIAAVTAFLSWAPRHFQTALGWNVQTVGLVLGLLKVVVTPIGVIGGGWAMDRALRSGVRAPYFAVPLVTTIAGGPLLALGLLQGNPILAVLFLTVGMLIFSAFMSSHYVVLQLLAPPSLRGRLTAVYLMTISLIGTGLGALLPPLLGNVASSSGNDFGRATALVIVAISLVVAAIFALGRGRLYGALREAQQLHERAELS